jgi:hypothetical protein
MKKIVILIICLFFAKYTVAQIIGNQNVYTESDLQQTRFGIEAGVNISTTKHSPYPNFSTSGLIGYNAGITVEVPVTTSFLITSAISYSQKGFSATTSNGNFTQKSQYVELPLLANIKIASIIGVYAGLQCSYLINRQTTYAPGFMTATEGYYNYYSNRVFFDGVAGISLYATQNIDIHATYMIDLNQNNNNGNYVYVPGYRNQVIQLGVGYKF